MRQSLAEWEASLEPYFEHIKLLGEIPITHVELEQLGNLIRDLLKRTNQTRATRVLETDYRRTYAVFLAAIAAHNTNRDYWRVVSEAVGIPIQRMNPQLRWGEIFLEVLSEFDLPTFQDVGGYRFVTPIRLHGGIPAYSLPDFYAYILWPSVTRDTYKRLATDKALALLLKRTTVQIAVDSPVTNFLDNGGEFAIDFFDRCRKMARLYLQSQEVPSLDEVNLPPYVVRIFQQWVDEELETDRGKRLRAPKLFLDPWGPDFYLHLPPESVEGLYATRRYFWRVEMEGQSREKHEHIERVRVRRRGYDLETSTKDLPLENPSQRIVVSYCSQELSANEGDGQTEFILRRWRIDLMPSDSQTPLVVFRPSDGRILSWNRTLPAEELWFFYPSDLVIDVSGEGRLVENFPDYSGDWGEWKIQSWDLRGADALRLTRNGKSVSAPIPVLNAPPDPILVGDNYLKENIDPDEIPLYIGSPPWIRIPVRPGRSIQSELSDWRLNIESRWVAAPPFHNELFDLTESSSYQEIEANSIDLPLRSFLGERPVGTYRLVATGPYDVRTELRFRVWPELDITGLEKYYLPDQNGQHSVKFTLQLPEGSNVKPQAGVEGIRVTEKQYGYEVTAESEVTVTELQLSAPLSGGDPVRLPLFIAIPRLRWSLFLGDEEGEIRWGADLVRTTVDALLQSEKPSLYFDFRLIDELPMEFNIILSNPEDGSVLQEHSRPQRVRFRQTRWRFDLGEFSDTIRQFEEQPIFDFQLVIQSIESDERLTIPAIRLNRKLDISDIRIDFTSPPEFLIQWNEPKPLRNRRVRIWAEWQPWLTPSEIKIPDEARNEYRVTGLELPPSWYRLEFITAPSWEEEMASPLPPRDSHLVKAHTTQDTLEWIGNKLKSDPDLFLLHYFRACVLEGDDDLSGRDKEITWCYQNLSSASPKIILSFHRWLGGYQADSETPRDPNSQKAVQVTMFRPSFLQSLFANNPEYDDVRTSYLELYSATSMIAPESALLLLEHDNDPARVMHGLQILIKRQAPEAIDRIVQFMESGQISDDDAGELLALDPDFALPALDDLPESQIKLRLITRMVTVVPDQQYFVLPGSWVRTDAGWGHIQKIISREDQNELEYFNRVMDSVVLYVILRPNKYPEEVIVDLAERVLTFKNARQVYLCIKDDCYRFASEERRFVRNEHNRASHDGIGPAFRQTGSLINLSKPEDYSLESPDNQFA